MMLAELWDQLKAHDWYHEMSDDGGVHRRGRANWRRIVGEAEHIEGGEDLCHAFRTHYYGPGTSFKEGVREPIPNRPTS